ncbi:hypothetical protein Nepgr_031092 [Nepenthes gracilis]|uniref:Inositol polyphosphate-related phosphatase domain-containing protein n=1 Tax=Nepenthes gracilis TaxID=150966 RepID=A0AAD3Y6Q3_NEPGR|nr:hypothetical protein Nepgr_031092 [Nepenthes gracilis]
MRDGNSKKSKLSWSKSLVKKWFNITCKYEDFQADEVAYGNKFIKNTDQIIQGREYLDHPGIVDLKNYSYSSPTGCGIFVATWNVGGKSPPSNLNSDDWLHGAPPADIFVLGFQEIVPLNASNILGAEDNGPAKKWLALIRKTLNDIPRTSGSSGCHTPSPVPNLIIEINADFEGSDKQKAASFLRRRSFQMPGSWKMDTDPSTSHPRHDRRYNVCDRVSFCRRPSDYRRSDFSRWGSFDEDCGPLDSPSTVLFSPTCCDGSIHIDDGYQQLKQSRYCLVVSKQMVGIFLTVWVRKDLRDSVRNVKVSCVGRGLMGCLGNKGSISVSMLLHQTSFCFICTHLTSGQKEGDELRRNSDVMEILKKTRFPKVNEMDDDKSPETIIEHDRVIWLGDLNYRVALSYRSVKALVEMQNWRALLERDQLRIEQKRGRVFTGWNEGNIYFLPTYKYLHNSDRYAGGVHPKEKRRTPAWCDRILWVLITAKTDSQEMFNFGQLRNVCVHNVLYRGLDDLVFLQLCTTMSGCSKLKIYQISQKVYISAENPEKT